MRGLAREREPLDLARRILGVEEHEVVAVGVHREVAVDRARVQVVLLAPHALQAWLEVVLQQALPRLALHALAAPVELEQHVRVEQREHLVEVHVHLAHAPEWRLGDRHVHAHRGA